MASKSTDNDLIGKIFFDKYKIIEMVGKGSFGYVYIAEEIKTKTLFALKVEKRAEKHDLLKQESYTLLTLKSMGIPKVYCYGSTDSLNIMTIELLGISLEKAFNLSNSKMSLKSVCMIGCEMISIIKNIHSKGYLHRDIKPDNYMFGVKNKKNRLYMIDFGLAKKYVEDDVHIPIKYGKSLVGTARYASINTHNGVEQSRRDDLESIGYILIYLIKGSLPWQGLKVAKGEDHFQKIMSKKIEVPITTLCSNLPKQFVLYFDYVKQLGFESTPDYNYVKNLYISILNDEFNLSEPNFDYEWLKNEPLMQVSTKEALQCKKQEINDFDIDENKDKSKGNSNNPTSMLMNKSKRTVRFIQPENDNQAQVIYELDQKSFG